LDIPKSGAQSIHSHSFFLSETGLSVVGLGRMKSMQHNPTAKLSGIHGILWGFMGI
jgi:hypothetical protein